jgi:hypothetical protein
MWGASVPITSYRITSAGDTPGNDPKSWTFQGCTGGCTAGADAGWVTLDSRSGETFASRLLSKSYAFSNATAYSQYRLRVTANAGGSNVQLREVQMFDGGGAVVALPGVDRTESGTVTWTGKPCSTAELATRAFDNLMTATGATRWCALALPSAARPVSAAYTVATPFAATSYRLTSSADTPARDPKSWTFEGCDGSCTVGSDGGWVTLDSRSNEAFASRYLSKTYTVANAVPFAQYRLRVTASNGDTVRFQLGELQIF